MAGIVKITVGTKEVMGAVNGLLSKLTFKGQRALLENLGNAMTERVRGGFQASKDPYGRTWKPLHPLTLKRRRKHGRFGTQPLIDTGRLFGSIRYETGRHTVRIGTDVTYAPKQQFGGLTSLGTHSAFIPPRPFLPIDREFPDSWKRDIETRVTQFLKGS